MLFKKIIAPGRFGLLRKKVQIKKEVGIMAKEQRRRLISEEEKLLEKSMINIASSSKESERIAAAEALEKLRDARAVPDLIRAFEKDKSPTVKVKALLALGAIADERTVKPLVEALKTEKDPATIYRISWVLGAIGSTRAIDLLLKYQHSENALVKDGARKALEQILKKHPEALKKVPD